MHEQFIPVSTLLIEGIEEMVERNKIHILNGQAMYNDFESGNYLNKELMIPFNEAMCFGNVSEDLFSEEFNKMRAEIHHVTYSQYKEITIKPLENLFNGSFSHIELWFDSDMFCQMNVLTVLALLDQQDYSGSIDLHIVDQQSEYSLKAMGYYQLYKQVFINKKMPTTVYPEVLKKGMERYLHYLNKDSDLMVYIQKHLDTPEKQLVTSLLNNFKQYGLGDTQYFEIIQQTKGNVKV